MEREMEVESITRARAVERLLAYPLSNRDQKLSFSGLAGAAGLASMRLESIVTSDA